jgi:DNA-directed RNA polymerase subunit RPC12/RpoP
MSSNNGIPSDTSSPNSSDQQQPQQQVVVVTSTLVVPQEFTLIRCRICNSKILRRQHAKERVVVAKAALPTECHDALFKADERDAEFWLIGDMFDFENIGFLKTVNDVKLLTCADCEREPLGVHVVSEEPKRYLIRTSRLKYE